MSFLHFCVKMAFLLSRKNEDENVLKSGLENPMIMIPAEFLENQFYENRADC